VRGFSMMELVVALAIMAILMVLTAPMLGPFLLERRVAQLAASLTASLRRAQATAISRSQPVEVFFTRTAPQSQNVLTALAATTGAAPTWTGAQNWIARLALPPVGNPQPQNTAATQVWHWVEGGGRPVTFSDVGIDAGATTTIGFSTTGRAYDLSDPRAAAVPLNALTIRVVSSDGRFGRCIVVGSGGTVNVCTRPNPLTPTLAVAENDAPICRTLVKAQC